MATSRRRERELARRRFERRRQAEMERRARAKKRNTVIGATADAGFIDGTMTPTHASLRAALDLDGGFDGGL